MKISRLNQRALGSVVLTLTFLAGAVAGTVALKVWSRSEMCATLKTSNMSAVLDELSLTRAQRLTADSILEHSAPRTEAIMLELARRMRSVADSVDTQLRSILTPQQQRRLDELQRKRVFLLKRRSKSGAEVVDTVYPAARAVTP